MGHFSYVGDAQVGRDVNIGAGAITCNFDGTRKHRTIIGDGAFIGSDTMLVAPVEIGERSSDGRRLRGQPRRARRTAWPSGRRRVSGPPRRPQQGSVSRFVLMATLLVMSLIPPWNAAADSLDQPWQDV